jgi:hypothetical protein
MITPTNIIERPAIPSQTFDKYWLEALVVSAPHVGQSPTAQITLRAFNSTTGEKDTNTIITTIHDVFGEQVEHPSIGTALDAVLQAVDQYCKAKELI